jgi:hypothetical protein
MRFLTNLLLSCFVAGSPALAQSPKTAKQSEPSPAKTRLAPQVINDSPTDAPLRVSMTTNWVAIDERGIALNIKVENVSEQAIRAYATRNAIEGNTAEGGCFLMNIVKPGKVLQPGQAELRTTWRGYPVGSAPPIHLSVDFVEFTDGPTWGADTCQSAERLDGQRTGARAATEALQKELDENGPAAVAKSLDTLPKEIIIPTDRSYIWQEEFRRGVENIIYRLRRVIEEGGPPEIEPALRQPYDASGYKIAVIKN